MYNQGGGSDPYRRTAPSSGTGAPAYAYNPAHSGWQQPTTYQQPASSMSYDSQPQTVSMGGPIGGPVGSAHATGQPNIWNPASQATRRTGSGVGSQGSTAPMSTSGGVPATGGAPYGAGGQSRGQYSQGMGDMAGLEAFAMNPQSQVILETTRGVAQKYFDQNMQRYIPFFTAGWYALKYYFQVNHDYVKRKLSVLLLPFVKKDWRREALDDGGSQDTAWGVAGKYQLPMQDENAPDLYIPLMAFITYVLVTGYAKGAKNSFTPEVLVEVTTTCLVTQLLEIGVIRLGFYLLQAPASFLDLLAITGYKYVPLNVNMLLGLMLGTRVYYLALIYTGAAITFFCLKTFGFIANRVKVVDEMKRSLSVGGFALLQFFTVWFLGYSGELS